MKRKVDEFESFEPKDRADWRRWLAKHHGRQAGIWLVYHKRSSEKKNVIYDEAVEEALCFGWIDSLPRKLDENRSMLMFTPRKPKSVWSKPNKERVERLIADGRMTEAGLEKIRIAKENGSWNTLDASDNLEFPVELKRAFSKNKTAKKNFDNFTESTRRVILAWINSAKREETKTKRIDETVRLAAENKKAGPFASNERKRGG